MIERMPQIGVDTVRKEAWDKVTGAAKYNSDRLERDMLNARILTSPYAHALIKSIDTSRALKSDGVLAVITGDYFPVLTGSIIEDRPPIARNRVRYFGEPVALVVAHSEQEAMKATKLIEVDYEPLPVINSIGESISSQAPLIHENIGKYFCPDGTIQPKAGSNLLDHVRIRKGDMNRGWEESDIVIESKAFIPQSDHLAMETRNAVAEILPDGRVIISTSSQAPFAVKEEISKVFGIPEGNIIIKVPLVGGAFGGKASVDLEFLAYLASRAVGGRKVRIANSREEDISSSPSKISTESTIKIGATKDGIIKALEATYFVDCGAYAGTGPRMAKAMASDGTGPYNIENVHIDSYSVYTNHIYVTSYRGFGHTASTFAMERAVDKLASALNMDPLDIRMVNAISEGDTAGTQTKITLSNTGDLRACILKLKESINWDEGNRIVESDGKIRAKGVSCFWKTSNSPVNAATGVSLTLNSDGSINLNFGATEIGPGMKTTIAQILAEKMKMDINDIHVFMEVDTQLSPKHWKTVASMTTFMVGNAVIKAAEDLIRQLKSLASIILACTPNDLEVMGQRVYLKDDPDRGVEFKKLVQGYEYPGGSAIWGPIIGRGTYIMKRLVPLDLKTGRGKTGVSWTVGAQAVEIEYDPEKYTYRLLKAATAIDVGKVINPKTARGLIMGGMSMGLGLGTREEFLYSDDGIAQNTSLRTYKLIHFGENPEYIVNFIETPQIDGPFGARGLAEHGIIGIPGALANAISLAVGKEFDRIPISPELIWGTKTGGKYDTF